MFLTTLNDNKKNAFLALAANVVPPCDRELYQSVLWREWLAEIQLSERTRIGWDDVTFAASHLDCNATPDFGRHDNLWRDPKPSGVLIKFRGRVTAPVNRTTQG